MKLTSMSIRRISAISLAVSFLAMATSGLMMFFIEKPSFTIQMHPVHKLFGLIMIVAVIAHISLNYRALLNHLKTKSASIYGGVLVILLVLLYGVAINNKIPEDLAEKMDAAAAEAESLH
jgi:hypothetical protein